MSHTVATDKALEKEALAASVAESQAKPEDTEKKSLNYKVPEIESSSWGDKYKRPFFNFNEHVTFNYALNTGIAATFAFFAEKYILNERYREGLAKVLKTTRGSTAYKAANYAVSAALLTMGGTSLLPFIKHAEENRQEYQYKLSQMLDKTQKTLGFSTEDTERNLADYDVIAKIAASKNCGEDCGIGEEEIKRLEGKYHFAFQEDGAIKFEKVHKSWGEMFKARGLAIAMSMATGAMLGASKGKPAPGVTEEQLHAMEEAGNFGDKGYGFLETKLVKPLSNILQKVPGFKKVIDQPMHYSKLLLEDAILTVVSAVTFAFASKDKAHTEQLDTNRDGWVSTEEAKEFKNKSPNAKIGREVQVEDIIRPSSNRHSHQEAAPKETHAEKHAHNAPAMSHVEKHAGDHTVEHSHTKNVHPKPAAHTQTHKATPSAHAEKLNVQRQNAQETPAALAP